jgi:L-lactate dehydrogenase complex protein LldF
MKAANFVFAGAARFRLAQRVGHLALRLFTGKDGWIRRLPSLGARWTMSRDLRALPDQTFRDWWTTREASATRQASQHEERR